MDLVDLADFVQPGDAAVGFHDPIFEIVGPRMRSGLDISRSHPIGILAVDKLEIILGRRRQVPCRPAEDLARRLRPDEGAKAELLAPECDLCPSRGVGDLRAGLRQFDLPLALLGRVDIDAKQPHGMPKVVEGTGTEVAEEPAPTAVLGPDPVFELVIGLVVRRKKMGLVDARPVARMDKREPRILVVGRLVGPISQCGEIVGPGGISLMDEVELPIGRAGRLQRQLEPIPISLQGLFLLFLKGDVLNRPGPDFGRFAGARSGSLKSSR